jgi:hypothetical protein
MLVAKTIQQQFPIDLATLPLFADTQREFVLFNRVGRCPFLDSQSFA